MTDSTARWRVLWAVTIAALLAVDSVCAASRAVKVAALDRASQVVACCIAGDLLSGRRYSPQDGCLKTVASRGFATIDPRTCVQVQRISLSDADISQTTAQVDVWALDHRDAAERWLAVNDSGRDGCLQEAGCIARGSR